MSINTLEKHLFNLKLSVKELERHARKCEKEEQKEKVKTKKAIQLNNMEVARIHAENAIRQRSQYLSYLRMSARVDTIASRLQTAISTKKTTSSISYVCKAMEKAMKTMDLAHISELMDKFETQFDNLEVQSTVVENAFGQSSIQDVDGLLKQIADEAGLELSTQLPEAVQTVTEPAKSCDDELTQRLAKLRQ